MSIVLGTWVPDPGINPGNEICHDFVYRWLIASGRITGKYPDPLKTLSPMVARQLLFPLAGRPARANGIIKVTPGSIIGFWEGPCLMHSMIAVSPTSWIGANNTGCFGTSGGRIQVNNIDKIIRTKEYHWGWIGDGNDWQGTMSRLRVAFSFPPMKHF